MLIFLAFENGTELDDISLTRITKVVAPLTLLRAQAVVVCENDG